MDLFVKLFYCSYTRYYQSTFVKYKKRNEKLHQSSKESNLEKNCFMNRNMDFYYVSSSTLNFLIINRNWNLCQLTSFSAMKVKVDFEGSFKEFLLLTTNVIENNVATIYKNLYKLHHFKQLQEPIERETILKINKSKKFFYVSYSQTRRYGVPIKVNAISYVNKNVLVIQ